MNKPNPLLRNMPAGNVTPGNWANSVWYQQDFSRVEFNGMCQVMRPLRGRNVRFDDAGRPITSSPIGLWTPPYKPGKDLKYRTKDGAEYFRTGGTGQIVRTSPRVHKKVSRRHRKRMAMIEREKAQRAAVAV
jgi:hypothetical protein